MKFLDNNDSREFETRTGMSFEESDFMTAGNNDTDLDYASDAYRGFDALKYAASLLTGTLLLDLTGSDRTVQDRALNEKAKDALEEARESILSARPRSQNAQHHNHHMRCALAYLEEGVSKTDRYADLISSNRSDDVFAAVQSAWNELKKLDVLIRGYRTVDLTQSCCAYHARQIAALAK